MNAEGDPGRKLPRANERKIESGEVHIVYDGSNLPAVHQLIDDAVGLGLGGQNEAKGMAVIKNLQHPEFNPSFDFPPSKTPNGEK